MRECHLRCQLLVQPGPASRNQPEAYFTSFSAPRCPGSPWDFYHAASAGTTMGENRLSGRGSQTRERSTLLRNTILVVEDEEQGRLSIQEALLADGHKVITSASGSHARELLASREENIKLVLLAWIMPDVEGIEVLKWIRRQRELGGRSPDHDRPGPGHVPNDGERGGGRGRRGLRGAHASR